MKIQYFEQDDELKYEYVETVHLAPDSRRRYRVEGTVPEKVINRGSEAIKSCRPFFVTSKEKSF